MRGPFAIQKQGEDSVVAKKNKKVTLAPPVVAGAYHCINTNFGTINFVKVPFLVNLDSKNLFFTTLEHKR